MIKIKPIDQFFKNYKDVTISQITNLSKIDQCDIIEHKPYAVSPSIRERENELFWYIHQYQNDALLTIDGVRIVMLYDNNTHTIREFECTFDYILDRNNKIMHEGKHILCWEKMVPHRVLTFDKSSKAINFATHYDGLIQEENFSVYSVDLSTGQYKEEKRRKFK